MKLNFLNLLALIFFSTLFNYALADDKPSKDERAKLESALSSMGCKGGHMEKEDNGTFEVDDAKCQDGEYDIEFGQNFSMLKKERD